MSFGYENYFKKGVNTVKTKLKIIGTRNIIKITKIFSLYVFNPKILVLIVNKLNIMINRGTINRKIGKKKTIATKGPSTDKSIK